MLNVAIIGAGLSGLTVANILKDYCNITIFEKSRGVGGRMSTRRAKDYVFDHGAQFFKVISKEFSDFIDPMIKEGVIKTWNANFAEIKNRNIIQKRKWVDDSNHYVGSPKMNSVCKYLSQDIRVELEICIKSIIINDNKWFLKDDKDNLLGEYDWVISSIPPAQASLILPKSLNFYHSTKLFEMKSCFALMLGFEKELKLEFDAAIVIGEDISWISVNSSKPNRGEKFCLLVNSTNNWADEHIEDDNDQVMKYLCDQTSAIIGYDVSNADHIDLHRWRYANIDKQYGDKYFIDLENKIGLCGDWFIQGRVESSFISGYELANDIKRNL